MMSKYKSVTFQLALGLCSIALISLGSVTNPGKAEAAVFKCTDANGNVSYNQVPCESDDQSETVLSTQSKNKPGVDCRIANNFARQTAKRMRLGESSGAIFDSYGGIDAMPRSSIGVVNYVFSHKGNVNTGPQRIAALSAARCSAGSYGPVTCDDFPFSFIAELGGCDKALNGSGEPPAATAPDNQDPKPVPEGSTHALGVKTTANQPSNSVDCKQDMQTQLGELFEQMRAGQSASEQGQLEGRKKALREQLSNC